MPALSPPTARENGLNLNSSPSSQLFPESCSKQVTWELALGSEWPVFMPVTRGVVGRGSGKAGLQSAPSSFQNVAGPDGFLRIWHFSCQLHDTEQTFKLI